MLLLLKQQLRLLLSLLLLLMELHMRAGRGCVAKHLAGLALEALTRGWLLCIALMVKGTTELAS